MDVDAPESAAETCDTSAAAQKQRTRTKTNFAYLLACKPQQFEAYFKNTETSAKGIVAYRRLLVKATETEIGDRQRARKLKHLDALIDQAIANGATVKRRKRDSGAKAEVLLSYKDTASNRRLDRVGKQYRAVRYAGSEYEDVPMKPPRKHRRRVAKSTDAEDADSSHSKSPSVWILALERAKRELGLTGFVRVLGDEKVPTEGATPEQVLSNRLYKKAREIQAQMVAESAQQ